MKSSLITTAFVFASLPVFAGSSAPTIEPLPAKVSSWEYRTTLYGWAQGLDGEIGILGKTADVNIGFDDIAQDLEMAFMGSFIATRDRWSFVADLSYAKIGAEEKIPNTMIDFTQEQFVGNFTINYEAYKQDSLMLCFYAGARVNWLDATLEIDDILTLPKDFEGSDSVGWVDPIIGARFRADLSEKFFFIASGDVGGFGVASDFTWQALAGFGYRLNDSGSLLLGYRAIGTDYTDGGFTYDLVASGLVIGYEYKF